MAFENGFHARSGQLRENDGNSGAAGWRRINFYLPADMVCALVHDRQPERCAAVDVFGVETHAIVGNREQDIIVFAFKGDCNLIGLCVLAHVRKRFLNNPEKLDTYRQGYQLVCDVVGVFYLYMDVEVLLKVQKMLH